MFRGRKYAYSATGCRFESSDKSKFEKHLSDSGHRTGRGVVSPLPAPHSGREVTMVPRSHGNLSHQLSYNAKAGSTFTRTTTEELLMMGEGGDRRHDFTPRRKKPLVELAISMDSTGSMYTYIATVRESLAKLTEELRSSDKADVRIAPFAHGDYCDKKTSYVIKYMHFTYDTEKLVKFFKEVGPTGGGDADEAYELVLRKMNNDLKWSRESVSRACIIVGDANPHEKGYKYEDFINHIDWRKELEGLKKKNITIYAVHCGGSPTSRPFYQELANTTGGAYLELGSVGDIVDLILAACLHQAGEKEKVEALKRRNQANRSLHAAIERVSRVVVRRVTTTTEYSASR